MVYTFELGVFKLSFSKFHIIFIWLNYLSTPILEALNKQVLKIMLLDYKITIKQYGIIYVRVNKKKGYLNNFWLELIN